MPPASTAPSWAVSPVRITRAPPARATAWIAARSVVDTWEASSITTTSRGPARMAPLDPPSSRRPRNWAMLYASARPSPAMTRAAFVDRVTPITRPPVQPVQARANAAMVWVLPAPAGATSTDTAVRAASSPAATSAWAASSPAAATAACAWAGVTSCGTSRRASATRYSSRSSHAAVVYRSVPGGVNTDRPSLSPDARGRTRRPRPGPGPRARTSPEASASSASSSASAAWSTPAAMAGMARCSSHSSDARVHAAAHFCAPATATRMMRARELASSSAGAVQALRPSERRPPLRAPADRASTSRSVVRASQASSSSPADRGPPCSAPAPCACFLALRVASVTSCAIAHSVRWDGSRPYRWPVLLRHPRAPRA